MKRTPIERGTSQLKRSRWTPKPTPDPIAPETRGEVAARSGGLCEARVSWECAGMAQHLHHRKRRRHGDHTAANLLHVCWSCHDVIHNPSWAGLAADWSYRCGYLLRSTDDPTSVLVRRLGA